MKKLMLVLLSFLPFWIIAEPPAPEDIVVSFDEVIIPQDELAFVTDWKTLKPDLSEFEIEYQRFLSNDLGERFALVTLFKRKSGLRIIDEKDIVGVLANGQRLHPIRLEGETQIGARGSIFVHFGQHQFPLAGLETRTE
ncbi:hypothetical protein [Pelagicoccus sp. SDUM812002]|uniref:hypothetical protein n=1 Tax=Pelagicoccus sp. SDUM812002 TaxID=3041266 RepID=UPI00280F9C83|nr:hypothetical protein [Pelagicoccus sp. SDUM812002]MDQ8185801.1 hypothetical protein [Pelagicoccus sp. SDUM812002]